MPRFEYPSHLSYWLREGLYYIIWKTKKGELLSSPLVVGTAACI
jgi:hypothetical protein